MSPQGSPSIVATNGSAPGLVRNWLSPRPEKNRSRAAGSRGDTVGPGCMRDAMRTRNGRSSGLNGRTATCSVPAPVGDSDCIWDLPAACGADGAEFGRHRRCGVSPCGVYAIVNEEQPMQRQVRVDMVEKGRAALEEWCQPAGHDDLGIDPQLGAGALDHALEHSQVPRHDPGAQLVGGIATNNPIGHMQLDV